MYDRQDTNNAAPAVPDRLVRLPELIALTGVSPSTLWRWERQGQFPARIHIGARAIGWRISDINKWLSTRCSEGQSTVTHAADPMSAAP